MAHPRKHPHSRRRKKGHDYSSRCIYHIVLTKAPGIGAFSDVVGELDSHEWPPTVTLSPIGEIIAEALSALKLTFPHIWIRRRCIMPDHVHLALFVRKAGVCYLGAIISALKVDCSRRMKEKFNLENILLFDPGYHDTILYGRNQLNNMLSYISDNPRRYLLRRTVPSWHLYFHVTDGQRTFAAYGNWELLDEPELTAVRFSSKYSEDELIAKKRWWVRTVLNDGILVSPFIHSVEKKARDWALENEGVLIMITGDVITPRYHPSGRYHDLCSQGRLLLISAPAYPDERERAHNLRMNKIAEDIAERKFLQQNVLQQKLQA